MTFGQHLEELRRRLLISLGTVGAAFVIIYAFFDYSLLKMLKAQMFSRAPEPPALHTLGPSEIIFVLIKISLAAAFLVASPVVVYHAWSFIAPGLKERERRSGWPIIVGVMVSFAAGVLLCYSLVLPYLYDFFVRMNVSAGTEVTWSATKVVHSALTMLLVFGLGFELPMVIILLTQIGLVTPRTLADRRKYAVLIIAAASAFITPPDVVSMLVLAGPVYVLYEVSIVLSGIFHRRRLKRIRG